MAGRHPFWAHAHIPHIIGDTSSNRFVMNQVRGDLNTILVPWQFKRVLGFRGVGNRCHFGIMRTISTVPLDATSQGNHNQPVTMLFWAEMAGGLLGGFVFRMGELMIL